jgi:glycosyltransferase involved in cell wall biosynthesis
MAICKPDYDRISSFIGHEKTLLCPHPVTSYPSEIREQVKNIVFVASAYLPNKDGIEWFIANCWPLIYPSHDVHLTIYGTVCSVIDITGKEDIVCKGFLPDIKEIYQEADLIINPVRFGAGLKIKNIEALAHGVPLVTTSHGARGLEAGIGQALLIADDPQSLSEAIISLITSRSLRYKLIENAGRFITAQFSPKQCFSPLLKAIDPQSYK